jgi:meso-butanediol dehydrogenase/(S,S)-butanediol dehydrogenase/diacetyl reductase
MASSIPERTGLLQGHLALVTGAASGIGRAIAVGYAREGARVVLTDVSAQGCAAAVAEIEALGGSAWAFGLDVTDVEAVREVARQVGAEIGDIDVLVNSAGILIREGIDSPQAHDTLRRVVDVNLFGCFNTIHAFLPALRRTRGNIINIASGAAFIAQAGCVGYSSSKAGLKMLTETMAVDLAADGIRVNALAPGVIETPMTQATRSDPARLAMFMRRTPMGRVGRADELAGPAIFLASAMASYVNGVTLPVDGGTLAT